MKKLVLFTMMLFIASFSKAQTGTCAAPTVLSTGIQGSSGDFYFDVPAVPGDFFVVRLTKSDTVITAHCLSTNINSGVMSIYVPSCTVFGTVHIGDVACIAKYCHSISGWCSDNDTDYGAFSPCVTIGGNSPNNARHSHGHH